MAFKICSKGLCGFTVTDLNEENYPLDDSILSASGSIYYTFEHSASVNVVTSLKYKGTRTIENFDISKHYLSENDATGETSYVTDESEFEFPIDGLFEITHILLPTKDFLLDHYTQIKNVFPNGVYFVDDNKIYKYLGLIPGNTLQLSIVEVSIEELMEINPTDTTIIKEAKNTFSLCKLKECYYQIVKKLLNVLCGLQECNVQEKYSQEILNRDIIWMAINAIRYAIEQGQYFEAQRLLEHIQGCGSICDNVFNEHTKNISGCGCNR